MNWNTYIFVAFCVFMFLVGMRLKKRFSKSKNQEDTPKVKKNQRPKMAKSEEPEFVKKSRIRREQRVKRFTFVLLFVLFGLMVFMIPALTKDIMYPEGVDFANLFLRCFIFLFTIYLFILGYIKVFKKKKQE